MVVEVGDHHLSGAEAAAVDDGFRDRDRRGPLRSRATTSWSSVTKYRQGRRPLRSRTAPIEITIGEGDGGGAVPRLGAVSCIGEEGGAVEIARGWMSMRTASATVRPLRASSSTASSRLVESEPSLREDGLELGGERRGAGVHAGAVAPDGVDFSVVREHAQRLGAVPGGRDVGGVALMEEREGRGEGGVGEVGVEIGEQTAGAHGLVDHVGGRERADIALRRRCAQTACGRGRAGAGGAPGRRW